ncbi:MAG: hypothetical protein Q9162_000350 [Coniocarpon cinnabarinum]
MEQEKPPPYAPVSSSLDLPKVPTTTTPDLVSSPSTELHRYQKLPTRETPRDRERTPHQQPQQEKLESSILKDLPQVPSHDPGAQTSAVRHAIPKSDSDLRLADSDDRTAAEALLGLGKAQQHKPRSPGSTPQTPPKLTGFETPLQYYPIGIEHTSPGSASQPEPLLALLTSSHPWLGGTLSVSSSAYTASKLYSPRIVQYGANLVENTVGTVGRRTGVEGSIRRYLDARQPSSSTNDPAKRIDTKILDAETARGLTSTAHQPVRKASGASVDSLPLYDENRSPAYEESNPEAPEASPHAELAMRPSAVSRSWSTQLMISTSGLGAALNENALRSLKFCLNILNGANKHVRYLVEALKRLLEDYNASSSSGHSLEEGRGKNEKDGDAVMTDAPAERDTPDLIAQRIKQLNAEIWNTLKNVVNTVSRYTGGALPENASVVVRWQLMSVPQRWQRAVTRTGGPPGSGEEDTIGSGNRMVEFAIEGLDMMDQVGGVVESTICSAERWLDSMGRKKSEREQDAHPTESRNEKSDTRAQH